MRVDGIEVQIQSDASKACAELDRLIGKLGQLSNSLTSINGGSLTGLANGVNTLATSMKNMSSVKSSSFDRLVSNLNKLSGVNVANLHSLSSGLYTVSKSMAAIGGVGSNIGTIADFTKSIGKLGGANVTKATTQLPLLTKSLTDMMVQLSKAPNVSNKVIMLTNAMANLASCGGRVGTATRSLNSVLNTYSSTRAPKARRSTLSLASAFGKFYASCFLLIRGIKKLGQAIGSSMDYIETYNYFNVITDKIGTEFQSAWKENGYASAEEYAKSFRERLTELTGKMSGYNIDENGTLSLSDSIGLGVDPQKLMNYQASIASITNAVGLMGETSVDTSKALSMLATDLSSLKNVELETVMTNLQSGLIGQSRALYKYGIDITNNTLQTYALANGIEKAVSEMTQAEKMQLRLLAILDQSKVAYGDMANTISSVANQYRMLKQQLSNLGRIIGNLFIPVLQKVLPFLNGLVIALQRVFMWIGNVLGVDWSSIMDGISSGYTDSGLEELGDDMGDVSDGFDDATESAKKFNKQLLSYHELNNLSSNDNSKSDSGNSDKIDLSGAIKNALGEYQNIWDKAFANMQNKAEEWANKITDFFKKIKDAWVFDDADFSWLGEGLGKKINDFLGNIDWESIKNNARKLGKALATFLSGAIREIDWTLVGKTIAEGLNTAVSFAWGFLSNFDFHEAGLAIANTINGFFANFDFKKLGQSFNTFVHGMWDMLVTAVSNIHWSDIWKAITDFIGEFDGTTLAIVFGAIFTKALIDGIKSIGIMAAFSNLPAVFSSMTGLFSPLITLFSNLGEAIGLAASGAGSFSEAFQAVFGFSLPLAGTISGVTLALVDLWNTSDDFRDSVVEAMSDIKDSFSEVFGEFGDSFPEMFSSISEMADKLYDVYDNAIKPFISAVTSLANSSTGKTISAGIEATGYAISGVCDAASGLIDLINSLYDALSGILTLDFNKASDGLSNIASSMQKLSDGFMAFISFGVTTKIKKFLDDIPGSLQRIGDEWERLVSRLKNLSSGFENFMTFGQTGKTNISVNPLNKLSGTFATGGFPEDGLFMANHNELVGKFSNGKTAVANNEQIITGITNGVAMANQETNYLLTQLIEAVKGQGNVRLEVNGSEILNVVRDEASSFKKQYGYAPL